MLHPAELIMPRSRIDTPQSVLPFDYTMSGPEIYQHLLRNSFCLVKCTLNSMLKRVKDRSYIDFITASYLTCALTCLRFQLFNGDPEDQMWKVTFYSSAAGQYHHTTALCIAWGVLCSSSAQPGWASWASTVQGWWAEGLIKTLLIMVTKQGLVVTSWIFKSQVERISSYSLYLALPIGLKQIGSFFILRDADHFFDSLLWSLGSSFHLL